MTTGVQDWLTQDPEAGDQEVGHGTQETSQQDEYVIASEGEGDKNNPTELRVRSIREEAAPVVAMASENKTTPYPIPAQLRHLSLDHPEIVFLAPERFGAVTKGASEQVTEVRIHHHSTALTKYE